MKNYGLLIDQMNDGNLTKDALIRFLSANGIDLRSRSSQIEKSIAPIVYYHQQAMLAAAGTLNFFGANNGTAASTNMKGANFTLPEGEHMVMTAMRVMYGVGATIDQIDWDYGATVQAVKNCNFQLINNNISQINLFPLTVANPELTTDDEGFIYFLYPILWKAQTYIQINVNQKSAAVANGSLRLEIHGIGLIS